MTEKVETYEVGDKLLYTDVILLGYDEEGNRLEDLPMDAIERQAEVTAVDSDGMVYVRYGDGVEDWLFSENMMDLFERVTWDTTTS